MSRGGLAHGVFVAGTDTGVGKTFVSTRLVRAARQRGERVAVMKPIASGASRSRDGWRNEDACALIAAAGGNPSDSGEYGRVNPYCFEPAVSPHLAAREVGVTIDLPTLVRGARELARDRTVLVVEGAGGWLTPIDDDRTMADVATALQYPVLLVVGLRLGCLNHAVLTRHAIDASGVPFAGWVANAIDPAFARPDDNVETLTRRLGTPPLARWRFAPLGSASEPDDLRWFDRLMDVLNRLDGRR